jgi:hypothetical protein
MKVDDTLFYLTSKQVEFTGKRMDELYLDPDSLIPVTVFQYKVPINKMP